MEEFSSMIRDPYEERIPIHADHIHMCTFNDRENSDYLAVLDVFERWVRLAGQIQEQKQNAKLLATVPEKPCM